MLLWGAYQELFRHQNILWQIRWGFSCLGLYRLCPIRIVACVDDSPTHDLIAQRGGIRFFSLESKTGRHTHGRDADLDRILPSFREPIESALGERSDGRWVVVSPLASRALAAFAVETGRELVCPPPELGHWLNDKANFLAALSAIGLPRLPGRWLRLAEARYAEIASEMGAATFVAQLARGLSGSGTAFIGSEEEYARAGTRFGDVPTWVAPDVGNLSFNINAIAMESGVVVSAPNVQLAGLPMLCCRRRGMYCGNDYTATRDVPAETLVTVEEQTERIGRWLASLGFRGLFGLDFVADPSSGRVYAVDLNPRWQGSTNLLTQAEVKAGRLPLAVAELAYRMGLLGETEILRHKDGFLQPLMASQVSLRCGAPGWVRVAGDVQPGIYSLAPGGAFLRAGLELVDLGAADEILVIGGVPRQGAWIEEGAHVLRASAEWQVMDLSRMKPLPWVEPAVRNLYELVDLRPAEAG
ncbi:MAG: hypothetical protein ABSD56_06460 [Bryobacteraceae bacterium]